LFGWLKVLVSERSFPDGDPLSGAENGLGARGAAAGPGKRGSAPPDDRRRGSAARHFGKGSRRKPRNAASLRGAEAPKRGGEASRRCLPTSQLRAFPSGPGASPDGAAAVSGRFFVKLDKSQFRREFSDRRGALSEAARRRADAAIRALIRTLPDFRGAPGVAGFAAFGAEPDLLPLFAEVPFFLPRYDAAAKRYVMARIRDPERDLRPGRYGISEPRPEIPAAPEELRRELLYLVPAVACDRFGVRIGRGAGWYDRMLAGVRRPPAAVIYACQLSEVPLPREEHDLPMGAVVTENEVIRCGNAAAEK